MNVKELRDSHRPGTKILSPFLERGLDILFCIYNEATVLSVGMVNAKVQRAAPAYPLSITQLV